MKPSEPTITVAGWVISVRRTARSSGVRIVPPDMDRYILSPAMAEALAGAIAAQAARARQLLPDDPPQEPPP
jgi:hypothetical protein